ncbi:tRNA N(3)-methylcytidine methyltransferase METTL6-like [Physella acuta]|uniref:tRNA N(3)-methylcytidine methyltransferase METTL6-like n=1 Tax=Physella acuta TaxID=109671 RepID=UPI0027DE6345|nr:tRNA N(3)-methylcytidine methyltransferase METTL6-like [Physella acuta]XP_059149836.1 tRNA N(3)-methylcytidine methyltransferase METTL6-like [Physella acuta]XP_059149837.1 tRNA N(3)-methylcytidine methyltransferase METTL6-like [Physella acuta]XP_059149838.1 tRNA N(3)-methylcytidine methyltransferase METTL6-like [Physella acuta]XP_059149839.1 tRNA N(3)-methylcytidine methyltransferase METTL6-like [Physella acuta]XP_059149840.1 tRNA N(3)-methylcytidine methyltransferase METTL6-like [Physella 
MKNSETRLKCTNTEIQVSCPVPRRLSEEELNKLSVDQICLSEFKQQKLEAEAQKNWDLFYKRNTTKFFKDRHWTKREFEDLPNHNQHETKVLFEVGCGVGNFMFPLLEEDKHLYFYACDFSPRAVEFVKSHPAYDICGCTAFQCDITKDDITKSVPESSVHIATLIFVLSAIHPEKMVEAVHNVAKTLKPGGLLLVRDYGLYDHAMLRFSKGHKLGECFYVRQDGTRAYYFSLEKLNSIMEIAGLKTVTSVYIQRSTVNKKEGLNVPRIFVQGKFMKTPPEDTSAEESVMSGAGDDSDNSKTFEKLISSLNNVSLDPPGERDTS